MTKRGEPHIQVENLTMAYGSFVVMHDLSFSVLKGDVFIIMGGSGCGKSTLMRHMVGLKDPAAGEILFEGRPFSNASSKDKDEMLRKFGVSYQNGALWSSMTLEENVSLPLEQYTDLSRGDIARIASLKLSLVGLRGFESFYPSEISGGMRKRAALARAIALDPDVLFFDEPSAGLDPVSSRRLDDLILELRDSLETTVIVVTHELQSIFAIGDSAVYLDTETRSMSAFGSPEHLLDNPPNERVYRFLTRRSE